MTRLGMEIDLTSKVTTWQMLLRRKAAEKDVSTIQQRSSPHYSEPLQQPKKQRTYETIVCIALYDTIDDLH